MATPSQPAPIGTADTTTNALAAAIGLLDIQAIVMFPVATRRRFAADAPTAPPYSRQRYRDALHALQGDDILPEEHSFLRDDNDNADTESVLSTALTDFTIEDGEDQALRHTTKIVNMYHHEIHTPEAARPGSSPRPPRRSRRAGVGKQRARPDSVPDRFSLADVSDLASTLPDGNQSTAGSLHHPPFFLHPDLSASTHTPADVVLDMPPQRHAARQRRTDLVVAQETVRQEYEQCGKRMAELDVRMRTIAGELIRLDRLLGHE
ncbi:hypothetical protein ColTof4_14057 [Colletotrichum tofieldiae]|nr:hypothetical protein ColTof3_14693 [Colletotrichum tofieldiae]GKT81634.1 hypothetical protein ColTof4_14057 [Colletotrichum tofieldiae]